MKDTIWKLFTSNTETLDAMIKACEGAKDSIDLEQFIFVPDNFGNKLIEVCARKAKEGVRVRFIWDAAGSFNLFGMGIIEELRNKGIELVFFKTLLPGFFDVPNYKSWYFRNHRRTLVIDNRIGFTGSICISEKYKDWRDTNIMIEGPVVNDMHKAFERMWSRALEEKLRKMKHDKPSDHEFKYISNNPKPRHHRLYHQVVEAIRNAKKSVYITTPYFVPTRHLARVLRLAVHRGVDVRIMMPTRSDHPFVDLSARTYFYSMLKSGVKIYLYKDTMLHAKTIIIDDYWSSVGTLNMDHVSLLYNFEASIISLNTRFASELNDHFMLDLGKCQEVTLRDWKERYWVEKFAGFFIKFIRSFF